MTKRTTDLRKKRRIESADEREERVDENERNAKDAAQAAEDDVDAMIRRNIEERGA
jgi:hypothetical protein